MNNLHLVSVSEAAKRIGVTRQRVHALIANGQLHATRLGRYHYIEEEEIVRYRCLPKGKPYAPRSTVAENSIDNSK